MLCMVRFCLVFVNDLLALDGGGKLEFCCGDEKVVASSNEKMSFVYLQLLCDLFGRSE